MEKMSGLRSQLANSNRKLLFVPSRLFICLLLICAGTLAQTDRGGIRGTITDPSGAVIAGALVTVTNTNTGVAASTKSSDAGTYNITGLTAGTYHVGVVQSGFKTLLRDNVVVDVGGVTGLDFSLQVGDSSQQVTVTTAAPILKTEQSSTSTEVSVAAYSDLPLSAGGGRSPQNFKYLTPGVNTNNSVNGGPQLSGQVSMEGITVQNAEVFGADNNVRFPPEAVGEMSVVTSAYSAEYGTTGGGVQQYTIKSGTNQYHGNAYEYLKNTVLDGRGFFNLQRPIDRQNEYGFSVGGPVSIPKVYDGRNKSFFFFSADWFKTRGGATTTITSLPNAATRNGDFSGYLGPAISGVTNNCTGGGALSGQIFDPSTTRTVNGQTCRDPFAGNVIPASRISPVAKQILSLVPATNTQALLNNAYLQTAPSFNNFNDYIIKFDQYFGTKHHLSGLFLDSSNPTGGGSLLPAPLATAGSTINSWDFARATYDWIVSPTLLNEMRLGYNRQIFTHQPVGSSYPGWQNVFGLPGYATASSLFPGIIWSANDLQTLGNQQFWYATSNTYVVNESVAWTKVRHNLKFGFEYDHLGHALWKDWPAQLTISRNETGLPSALGATGQEAASFLLGQIDNSNIPSLGNTSVNYLWRNLSLYAQDDYKVTPRLTINYGLRWDLFMPMTEEHNILSAVDLSMPNPSVGNLPGSYVFAGRNGQGSCLSSACNSAQGLAPRFGFAWKLSDRLVVRGGYGISYFPTGLYGAGNNVYLTDGYDPTSTVSTPDNGTTPAATFAQGFPASSLRAPNLTSSYGIGSTFNYWSHSAEQVADVQSWNISAETQLAPNLALDVAWVGTKGTHLSMLQNINQLNPAYLPLGTSLLNSNINSSAVAAAGFAAPWPGFSSALGANATLAQALRPYPQFLSGFGYNSNNDGNSSYEAMQAKLEKRASNGLYLLASYTYDKSITSANSTLYSVPGNNPTGSGEVTDQYNLRLARTVASAWQPHVFTAAFNYELPIGPGKRFLTSSGFVGRLTGGWHVSGILTYRTGSLISVTAPQNLPLFAGANYASPVLGIAQKGSWSGNFDPASDRYLNTSAFTLATPGAFGTGGQFLPNLFAPFYKNEDLSVSKVTVIKERFNLELRLEAFNAFNRVVFGAPSGTASLNFDVSNPSNFGKITTTANLPRNAQIAMKLNF